MGKRKKPKMEFRYYKMPEGSPILALLGEKWLQSYGRDVDYLHFHNFLEIGYCYGGQGDMVLGEQNLRFKGNQYSVIPRNYPHTTNSDPGTVSQWEYLFVDVENFLREHNGGGAAMRTERMIQRINSRAVLVNVKESPKIAGLIRQLLDIMRETKEYYLEEAKGILVALLINLVRENHLEDQEYEEHEEFEGDVTIPISRALDCITLHYMEPLKVGELAEWCHMSETHFRRTFSAYMKMSPLEYINLVRVRTACEYLKKTDVPVSDIAHKCGFTTLSTFNRNFKQITGYTPHEWRKRPENFEQQLLKFQIHSEAGW